MTLRLMELGLVLSVIACPLNSYTEFKVIVAHFGLVFMAIGLVLSQAWTHPLPLDVPILVYLGVVFLACLLSVNPRISIFPRPRRGDGWLTIATYGATALVASRLPLFDRELLLGFCVVSAALTSFVALAQAQGFRWAIRLGGNRPDGAWGTLGNPSYLAGYLALLIPVALWHEWDVASVLMVSAAFTAASRAGLLSLITIAAGMVWVIPAIFTLPAGVGIVLGAVASQRMFERTPIREAAPDRVWLWGYLLERIARRPLLGYGPNLLMVNTPDERNTKNTEIHDMAHNGLLEIAVNTGFLGVAAFAWVWMTAFRHARFDALAIGLVAYAVWWFFNWETLGPANMAWMFLGMVST